MALFFTDWFGTNFTVQPPQKTMRKARPVIEQIYEEQQKLRFLSDVALREKTNYFRELILNELRDIDEQRRQLKEAINSEGQYGIADKAEIALDLERLEKERFHALNKVLDKLLPEAYAVVRETARRLKENGHLSVPMTDYDREMLPLYYNVEITENDVTAVWPNSWLITGNPLTWEMEHHEVQLVAGWVLHQGKLVEMDNGEGKTLVASLPAYLNALSGAGVHIATANDYLARRDADWMGPIYAFLGLRTGCTIGTRAHSPERAAAYSADITYSTVDELAFDYLRDNMVNNLAEVVQRRFHFLLLDEVDFTLIDEARTPLTISGPESRQNFKVDVEQYRTYNPIVKDMVEEQMKVIVDILQEYEAKTADPKQEDEIGLAAYLVNTGAPKHPRVRRFLHRQGVETKMFAIERKLSQMPAVRHEEIDRRLFYKIENDNTSITERGEQYINDRMKSDLGLAQFFNFPDILAELQEIDRETITAEKLARKEQLIDEWNTKEIEVRMIHQLLRAHVMYECEVQYIVEHDEVVIIDENSQRKLPGRRYSGGLHQALEAKEGLSIGEFTCALATVTVQNYCRRYPKLSGMSATVSPDAREFWEIYKLRIEQVPPHRPVIRIKSSDRVYKTKREKYNAIIEEVQTLHQKGRPVLIGTNSVEESELLSRMLRMRGIDHAVLNARYHRQEANIIAQAGQLGAVTISTNMAGRGTDIKLGPGVREVGGLAVIGTERHDSRRLDHQLIGRAGRQGNPGSAQFFVSLDDRLMRMFQSERIAKLMDVLGHVEGEVIQHSMVDASIERAQKKVEENNYGTRLRLFEYDSMLDLQREALYRKRSNMLRGERLQFDIMNIFYDLSKYIIESSADEEYFRAQCYYLFGFEPALSWSKISRVNARDKVKELFWPAYEHFNARVFSIGEQLLPIVYNVIEREGSRYKKIVVPLADNILGLNLTVDMEAIVRTGGRNIGNELAQIAYITFLDEAWKSHLALIEDLKEQVNEMTAGRNIDPIIAYKTSAFHMYEELLNRLNQQVVRFLSHAKLQLPQSRSSSEDDIAEEEDLENNYPPDEPEAF